MNGFSSSLIDLFATFLNFYGRFLIFLLPFWKKVAPKTFIRESFSAHCVLGGCFAMVGRFLLVAFWKKLRKNFHKRKFLGVFKNALDHYIAIIGCFQGRRGADPYNLIGYLVRFTDIFIETCRDRRPRLSEKINKFDCFPLSPVSDGTQACRPLCLLRRRLPILWGATLKREALSNIIAKKRRE